MISWFTWPARWASVSVTRLACVSSCSSASSRLLRLRDRFATPSSAPRSCGVASRNVSVSVCSACSNFGLSSSLAFPPRSCSAVFSVYGVVVRPNGIDVDCPRRSG